MQSLPVCHKLLAYSILWRFPLISFFSFISSHFVFLSFFFLSRLFPHIWAIKWGQPWTISVMSSSFDSGHLSARSATCIKGKQSCRHLCSASVPPSYEQWIKIRCIQPQERDSYGLVVSSSPYFLIEFHQKSIVKRLSPLFYTVYLVSD